MTTVDEILRSKGAEVWTIAPDATVFEALTLMADKNVGALIVTERGEICGILSERDYARKVILTGRSSKQLHVRDIMSTPVQYVLPSSTIKDCMALMTVKHIRHLPVMRDGQVSGLVSIGDVVKVIIDDQETMIRDLEQYITGRR